MFLYHITYVTHDFTSLPLTFKTDLVHSRTIATPWGAYTPIATTTIIPGATE